MPAVEQKLIHHLQKRNAERAPAIDSARRPTRPILRATAGQMQAAERGIGFKLPPLLRAIYLKVGNGGFGPEYGIVGVRGGAKLEGCTLETCYQKMIELEKENKVWRWPRRLLPLANYGCGMWSCVDCAYAKLPMILWDPNNLNAELAGAEARLNWANSFWTQGLSLNAWLEGWLAQTAEPEPRWPSTSWMKKRLGYVLAR
jgi:hypothetical protein